MKKQGLAKFGQILGNVFTGHLKDYEYPIKKFARWDIPRDGKWIMKNVNINVEFAGYERYGFTPAQILRIATLGNMEILNLDKKLGSLDEGKYADMVLLGKNPLKDISAIEDIKKVFKNGRCYVDKTCTN